MSFNVVKGYVKMVATDEVNGAEGDVEVGGEGDVGKEARVVIPLCHPTD